MTRINKLQAAKRHLNFAVRAYFEGRDIVPIMLLVGAAHVITHDLVDKSNPNSTWAHVHSEANEIPVSTILNSLREITNWLKHADKDSESELTFGYDELNFLLFHTTLDLGELNLEGEVNSEEVSVFQLWFVAKYPSLFQAPEFLEMLTEAIDLFPSQSTASINSQLEEGLVVLDSRLKRF